MSATRTVGDYEIGTVIMHDLDEDLHMVKMGVKSRTGNLILQAIWVGTTPEQAVNRAEAYCELMTALKPPKKG